MKRVLIIMLLLSIGLSGCYYSTKDYSKKSKSKPKIRMFYDVVRGPSGYCDSIRSFDNGITIYKKTFPNDSVTYINVPVQITYVTE
jgi:hypothetical protein